MTTIINGSSPSVTFSDGTTQTTAGLPLTGGTLSGGITFPYGSGAQQAPSKVLQVVQNTSTSAVSSTSSTYVTSGVSASITPLFSTSKILILVSGAGYMAGAGTSLGCFTVFRGTVAGTDLSGVTGGFTSFYGTTSGVMASVSIAYLDSPATTNATTYTVGMKSTDNSSAVYLNSNSQKALITLMEIAA
jgi:hypothetical protein